MMVRYAINEFTDFYGNIGFTVRHRPTNGISGLNAKNFTFFSDNKQIILFH